MENPAIQYKMTKKCGTSKHKDIGIQTFFSSSDSVPDVGHTAQSDCDSIQVNMHMGTVNHNSVLDNSDPGGCDATSLCG
jgi:hypothetical protein